MKSCVFGLAIGLLLLAAFAGCGQPGDSLPVYGISSSNDAKSAAGAITGACQQVETMGLDVNATFSNKQFNSTYGGYAIVNGGTTRSSTNNGTTATDTTTVNVTIAFHGWVIGKDSEYSESLTGSVAYYNYAYYWTTGYNSGSSHSLSASGGGIAYLRSNTNEWSAGYGTLSDTINSLSVGNGDGSSVVGGSLKNSKGTTYSF